MNDFTWDAFDYAIAAVLITLLAGAIVVIAKRNTSRRTKLIAGAVALAVFVVIWAELGVGLFGTPIAGD